MVYARVTSDIDAANKIALTLDGYFDLILTQRRIWTANMALMRGNSESNSTN